MTPPSLPPIRIIPKLEIKGENVVKGIQLEGLRVVGEPEKMSYRYHAEGADEIFYVDTVASLYGQDLILDLVRRVSSNIFIPLCVGGGIRTLGDIETILEAGAIKVLINTGAVSNPKLINDAVRAFGSQAICIGVELKKTKAGFEPYVNNGRDTTGLNCIDWIREIEARGAGEIAVTCIDQDGRAKGYQKDIMVEISNVTSIPVIVSGGYSKPKDIADLHNASAIRAFCIGRELHYERQSIGGIKQDLADMGIGVRL